MKRSRSFHILNVFCGFVSLFMFCFGGLVLWVATGPRSLDAFTPYIESALIPADGGYKVKIGSSMLLWDGVLHPVAIRIRDVDILDAKGTNIAHFPEIGLQLYMFELMIGKLDIKSVELLRPVAKLVQDDKGNITSFGFNSGATPAGGEDNASIPVALALFTSDAQDNPVSRLRSFTVRDAALTVMDNHGKAFLSSPNASIEITRKHSTATGKMRMPLQFGDRRGDIDISFNIDGGTRSVSSSVVYSEIPSDVLHALAPTQQWMAGVQMPLSGWAKMKSDFDANISSIDFMLDTRQGTINFPDQFEKPLKLNHVAFAGTLTDKLTLLTVKQAQLDFGTFSLSYVGTVRRQGDDVGVDGDMQTANITIDDIHRYWPLKLAPHSRHWVITRLSGGKLVKGTAAFHFKPGDFKLKDTPEAAVDANLVVKGTKVLYKPGHPPITDVDGTVRFTGRSMDAKISAAKYLNNTVVKSARARFPDFYPDDVQMVMEMELTTTAKDVQKFLSLPDLNKAAKLNLTPDITGAAEGNATLDFIAFSENDKDDVGATGKLSYTIDANLINVSQKRFMGERDVEDANMKIALNNKGIKANGTAKVNGLPMDITLSSSFGRDNVTNYAINTTMPITRMPDFGLPKLDFATGSIDANASFVSSDTQEKATAMLDLTRTGITLPEHGFAKKAGQKATLKLSTERLPSGNTHITAFTYKQDKQTASGEAEYDRATEDFSRLTLAPLQIGLQDMDTLTYVKSSDTVMLKASGKSFDATPYISPGGKKSDLAYIIDLRANRVILGANRELNSVAVQVDCPPEACRSAHITAKLKEGTPFNYTIASGRLESSCDNAGELSRTLGIFDTIDGGKMSMKAEYKPGMLEGALEVKDYKLKNAPVLTKMFTLASLTGILNTMMGDGIYFDKLTAPFDYHKGIIVLKGARTHGSALGFTADGVVDITKNTLDLTGLLVPSYTLNSLVGNIPLIGNWIIGKKGAGLVALSYGIHGDMKDPTINVNPLSVLTPGFLRDIFNIFDKPPPDMDAIEKAQKKESSAAPASAAPVSPAVPAPAVENAPAAPLPQTSTLPLVDELQK